jgi:LPXTG-site transpeptidase (sortase) family protein
VSRRTEDEVDIASESDDGTPYAREDGTSGSDDGASARGLERLRQAGATASARAADLWRRARAAIVASLPIVARVLVAIGVLGLLFVAFVVVIGGMRHTTRQEHLERAFQTRVSRGHADGPNWRPLPGQAIGTISIPAIGLYEVVVHDTTVQLLEGGPGHLLGTPLPGHAGNSVILGRRVTNGGPFGELGKLSGGDPITVVTPSGIYRYEVVGVSRMPPQAEIIEPTPEARLTLVTSASSFVPSERLVVSASLDGTPIVGAPVPQVELTPEQLGGTGDPSAFVLLIPWVIALIAAIVAWFRVRGRFPSRWTRFAIVTPVLVVLLYFIFVNADDLLPGVI